MLTRSVVPDGTGDRGDEQIGAGVVVVEVGVAVGVPVGKTVPVGVGVGVRVAVGDGAGVGLGVAVTWATTAADDVLAPPAIATARSSRRNAAAPAIANTLTAGGRGLRAVIAHPSSERASRRGPV
jgi:hypothetical protein